MLHTTLNQRTITITQATILRVGLMAGCRKRISLIALIATPITVVVAGADTLGSSRAVCAVNAIHHGSIHYITTGAAIGGLQRGEELLEL